MGLAKPFDQPEGTAEALERSTAEQPLKPPSGGGAVETIAGMALGTPGYMSPEQAAGRLAQVGPASDIYGLGATLYSLLTGRGPFAGSDAGEVLQRVQKGDFPPPRVVQASVPQPLEAICLKALAQEPTQRYRTAKELTQDVEHWLADEPVPAYREPIVSRLGRWARRHRPLVAGLAVLLLSAVVALTISTVLIGRQQRATLAQKQQAERNLALAKKAVENFLNQVVENPRLKETDLNDLVKELLESALPYYQEFALQKANDPELEAERGRALYRLAKVRQVLGESDKALAAYQQMEQFFAPLVQSHSDQADFRRDLARSHDGQGQILAALGRRAEAEQSYQRALALAEHLKDDFPLMAQYHQHLAASHYNLGSLFRDSSRSLDAEHEFRQSLRIRQRLAEAFPNVPDHRRELASSHWSLGGALLSLNRLEEAAAEEREALALLQRLAAEFRRVPDYRRDQAEPHSELGRVLRLRGQSKEAVSEFEQAAALLKDLARDFPSVVEYRAALGRSYLTLGLAQKDNRDLAVALQSFRRGQALYERLADAHPAVPDYRDRLATARTHASSVLVLQGDYRRGAAEVSRIDERMSLGGEARYNVACFWSLAFGAVSRDQRLPAAEKPRLAQDYAALALGWLAKARDAGFFQGEGMVRWLKQDTDLDPLRDRPDFQKFLAELEKRSSESQ